MIKFYTYLIIIFSLTMVACRSSRNNSSPRNLERIYDPLGSSVHPQIKIYNTSDTTSVIVEKIYTQELLFNQANEENKLLSRIKIIYKLYDLDDKQKLKDSLTTTFRFEKDADRSYHLLEIPVRAIAGHNYFLEIITIDQNRRNYQYSFKNLNRLKEGNKGDYIVYNKNNGEKMANLFIKEGIPFGIKNYKQNIDSLYVFFYTNDRKAPQPPYVKETITESFHPPDSNWVCYTDSINYSSFINEGIYYFSTEKWNNKTGASPENGFAMFNFGNYFPVIKTPEDLIAPLDYLGLKDSIPETDSTGKMAKLTVDNFWLSRANNIQRSRELLRVFYKRVQNANMHFSSFKEGWQTDRGMIYIVYGLPDFLFKSGKEEKWIYNPAGMGPGISFTFTYRENPFSENHYVLEREKLKATGWDEAVKLWNNGEVFYYQY